jgi:hypothetical protein
MPANRCPLFVLRTIWDRVKGSSATAFSHTSSDVSANPGLDYQAGQLRRLI